MREAATSHKFIESSRKPGEECGVVAIYAPTMSGMLRPTIAENTELSLRNLQHRGQDCAAVAIRIDHRIIPVGGLGQVDQALKGGKSLVGFGGEFSLGHVRYATSYMKKGTTDKEKEDLRGLAIQPMVRRLGSGEDFAIAYNGHISNISELVSDLKDANGTLTAQEEVTDTAVMTSLIKHRINSGLSVSEALLSVASEINGAYSVAIWGRENGEEKIWALRDPQGLRPLTLGSLPDKGWIVASEEGAFGIVGAEPVGEIEPGQLVEISKHGLEIVQAFPSNPRECIFERIYLHRPDGRLGGQRVERFRVQSGHQLAIEHPVEDADVVICVPESGIPAAKGYASELGIPNEEGFVKNRYNPSRSFLESTTASREDKVRLKISSIILENVEGKKVVVVDDSLVRSITMRILINMLRVQGKAKEIHVRLASPPIRWPCFYGVDMPNQKELIAAHHSIEEIRQIIGADSLAYLSLEGLLESAGVTDSKLLKLGGIASGFCDACMTGNYPTPIHKLLP